MRMKPCSAILTGVLACVFSSPARALDCPCTWEEVLCGSDAVAEIEVFLATKETKDRMEVRRVIWNQKKQAIRPPYGLSLIHYITPAKAELQMHIRDYHKNGEPSWDRIGIEQYERAVGDGRYSLIGFLHQIPGLPWGGGGVALNGVEWLNHPRHAEWWADIKPLLDERIRLAPQHKKPAYCEGAATSKLFAKYK